MSSKCEKQDCNNDRSCFHYCSKHHQEICMKGIVSHADFASAMQARIEKLEKVRKAAQTHMDFHGKPKGISKTNDDLLDALAECDR